MPLLLGTNVTKAPQLAPSVFGGERIRRPAGPPRPENVHRRSLHRLHRHWDVPQPDPCPRKARNLSPTRSISHASEAVCLARPDGGAGFGSRAEIQPQISTL